MKQKFILAAFLALISTASFAQTIVASKHDLSTGGGITDKSTNESQVCIFCHTPHQKTITATPLWNKTLSSNATYGVYASSSSNATLTEVGSGGTVSNLCLSCHDGTVAVNSLDNKSSIGANPTMGTGTELDATGKIAATRVTIIGNSLTNDHPINFTYDAALVTADGGGLVSPTSASYVDAAHAVPLYAGKLQCASCHNPHNNANTSFLRKANSGSALCLTCHSK
ncbi:MAG: cytochrome c3 family protein [Ignavibacteria bacterium]|nr:cytochrome c3 family protein [Ignavibacteria bacterium]